MSTIQEQLDLAQTRLSKNLKLKSEVDAILADLTTQHQKVSDELQAHLVVLTQIEMDKANFIEHAFGIVSKVTVETADTTILHFDEEGQVEAAIATELDTWKDSSHVTLHQKGV